MGKLFVLTLGSFAALTLYAALAFGQSQDQPNQSAANTAKKSSAKTASTKKAAANPKSRPRRKTTVTPIR